MANFMADTESNALFGIFGRHGACKVFPDPVMALDFKNYVKEELAKEEYDIP